MLKRRVVAIALGVFVIACGGPSNLASSGLKSSKIYMLSSQGGTVSEAQALRQTIFSDFNEQVIFDSSKFGVQQVQQVQAEARAGRGTVDLISELPSEMLTLQQQNMLQDLTPLMQRLERDRRFDPTLIKYGQIGGKQYFIPWLQATYMMAASKKALRYLPKGADLDHLSYDQLIEWTGNIQDATGQRLFGLPANTAVGGGLIDNFIKGYLYPSFTGSAVIRFRSPEAIEMWKMLRRLWTHTNKQSTTYALMQEPLQDDEVWVAWDHQARLGEALKDSSRFVAFPAPYGPRGLASLPALAMLAIPKNAPNERGAEQLIDYLTQPEIQVKTSSILSFSPAVETSSTKSSNPALIAEAGVTSKQIHVPNALPVAVETGLGIHGNEFNDVYTDAFEAIILRNQDISSTLNTQAQRLQGIFDETKAHCWPPDPPSKGPCQIK